MNVDSRLTHAVVDVVTAACKRILDFYGGDVQVQRKGDQSPVTPADLEAHRIVAEGLKVLEPGLPILSEEGELASFDERCRWNQYWLVDPLDGTRGFIAGSGEFTVNVALVSGHRTILGVVAVPVRGVCYYAAKGSGAYMRHADGTPESIRTRSRPSGQLVVLRSRTRLHAKVDELLTRLPSVRVIRASSSLKACLVAQGVADLYPAYGPTSEWDTAAAQCLVEEAGGRFTDLQLEALRYNRTASLENPPFVAFGDPRLDWRSLLAEPSE